MRYKLFNMKTDPYTIKTFGSYKKATLAAICMLGYNIEWLEKKYPVAYIDDIQSYFVASIRKIYTMLYTTYDVISKNSDYISACALLRCLADNICVINLIYCNDNLHEKEFRHYLYVIDGLKATIDQFPDKLNNNEGIIPDEEFIKLKARIDFERKNRLNAINKANEILNKHPYMIQYPQTVKEHIKYKNWKYKDISQKFNKYSNQLSWRELYKRLNPKDSFSKYFSFLGQFVHGLSISNLNYEDVDNETYENIYSWILMLTNYLNNAIYKLFPQYEIQIYHDIMVNENKRKKLFDLYTKEYLEELRNRLKKYGQ